MTMHPPDNVSGSGWRRITYDLTGIVQGVGFRPTLCRLARDAGFSGFVQNRAGSVRLVLEGPAEQIRSFLAALPGSLPPHARLDSIAEIGNTPLCSAPARPFRIAASDSSDITRIAIPADLATCPDCRREIFDPADRRHGYPFTTCTRCGPRYTVINGMPYDRARTTLSVFPLCPACRREYEDPADRRFHAESIACPICGPRLWLEDAQGRAVSGDPLRRARAALAAGAIVAVRGLGGFHLAADAVNRRALEELRRRKRRPHKPFAVMARAPEIVRAVCELDNESARLLASAAAPIVILEIREGRATGRGAAVPAAVVSGRRDACATVPAPLPLDLLSPDTRTLGVMLPATPLHHLLATPLPDDPTPPLDWLLMTSGNRGGEPICIANDEARERLRGIADFFLLHDREINLRCDDSLIAACRGDTQLWRRARGFAPDPLRLRQPLHRTVLAMGAELKNTIAIGYDDRIVASPHIGDLEAPEAVDGLRQVAEALPRFVRRAPEIVAVDLHPDLHSSRVGREIAQRLGLPVREVQHHHAHAAACLGEHGLREGLALVFDGAGLGTDGQIWGAELLEVRGAEFRRRASFAGVPLPGGDAAVRHPARQLAGRCFAAGIDLPPDRRAALGIADEAWQVWQRQCAAGVHAPVTHAAGRLFDSFAALLGLASDTTTYEGQTAIRLEAAARQVAPGETIPALPYRATRKGDMLWIDWSEAFRLLAGERNTVVVQASRLPSTPAAGTAAPLWAYAAHAAIAAAATEMVRYGSELTGLRTVALSGGVFMNRILTGLLTPQLEAVGFTVLQHRDLPPNDGGIAVGQALVTGVVQASRLPNTPAAGTAAPRSDE